MAGDWIIQDTRTEGVRKKRGPKQDWWGGRNLNEEKEKRKDGSGILFIGKGCTKNQIYKDSYPNNKENQANLYNPRDVAHVLKQPHR